MKRIARVLAGGIFLVLVGLGIWFHRVYQPWMPAGRAVHLSSEHFGAYDFQVWQRKNTISTEPFATGLFVRKQGDPWKVFLLDFQDSYRSSIVLRPKGAG